MRVLSCQSCGSIVLKDDFKGTKVHNKVILVKGQNVFAVCKGCGAEVSIPFELNTDLVKALPVIKNPKLFIK